MSASQSRTGYTVKTFPIAKAITRYALGILVFIVFFLSVLASPNMDADDIMHAAMKATIAGVMGYLFLLLVFDTVVKSIVSSAIESQARRREGGLIFHFLKPDPDEVLHEDGVKPG